MIHRVLIRALVSTSVSSLLGGEAGPWSDSCAVGYPGFHRQVERVRTVLEQEGFGPVYVIHNDITVPVETSAWLRIGTARFPVYSFYPNLVASGPNALTGTVVYVGQGTLDEVKGVDLDRRIVALDLCSGNAWQRLAGFGVQGFLFLQPPPGVARYADYRAKVLETPLEIPRLLLPFEYRSALLDSLGKEGTGVISRALAWQTLPVPTLAAFIPGKERVWLPGGNTDRPVEAVALVHVRLDAPCLVPAWTPPGDTTFNLETLERAIRLWKERPPPMTLLVVAFGGESMAGQASRHFGYRFLSRAGRRDSAEAARLERELAETVALRDAITPAVLADPLPWLRNRARGEKGMRDPLILKLSALVTIERNRISSEIIQGIERGGEQSGVPIGALISRRDALNYIASLKYRHFEILPPQAHFPLWIRTLFRARNADEPDPPEWVEMAPILFSSFLVQLRERLSAHAVTLERQRERLREDHRLGEALAHRQVVFTLGLDLTAGASALALAGGGDVLDFEGHRTWHRQIGDGLRPFVEALNQRFMRASGERLLVNVLDESRQEHWRRHVLYPVGGTGEILGLLGLPGLVLCSAYDLRTFYDTPEDRLERLPTELRTARSEAAATCLVELCEAMARLVTSSDDGRKRRLRITREDPDNRNWGTVTGITTQPGSEHIEKFMRGEGGVLVVRTGPLRQGWRDAEIVETDTAGRFRLPLLPTAFCPMGRDRKISLTAFRLDAVNGRIVQALDRGQAGGAYPTEFILGEPEKGTVLSLFDCETLGLLNCYDPRGFAPLKSPRLYAGRSTDTLRLFGLQATLTEREAAVACFVPPGRPVRVVFQGPDFFARLMLLNSDESEPLGRGVTASQTPVYPRMEWQSAHDLWWRTDTMRVLLAKAGIQSAFVDYLQKRAWEALKAAEKAWQQRDVETYYRQAFRAWSIVTRSYPAVLRLAAANVNGLVFYLFLIIPVAVLLERLLFSFTRILYRAGAITGMAVLLYQIIALLHPGVRILRNPLVLFIAFGLMALTSYVVTVVWSRFEAYMARLKMKTLGVTRESINRGAAFGLALSVGIGNMRRSPSRTVLTLIALTLFTVVVVSLIAVKSSLAVNAVSLRYRPDVEGLLLRSPGHEELPDSFVAAISALAGNDVEVHAIRTTEQPLNWTPEWTTAGGISGLPTSVIARILVQGRVPEADELACLLPWIQDPAMGVDTTTWVGAVRRVAGLDVQIVGLFDPEAFEQLTGLDGEPLTPIDRRELRELLRILEARGEKGLEIRAPRLPARRSVILSPALAEQLQGLCNSILLTSPMPGRLRPLAREFVLRTDYLGYYAENGEGWVFSLFDRGTIRGLADIGVPVLICGLIILNTMLGSVAGQMRHIPTFSAIGLAPKHIANLFLVEALVYSVVAALAGFATGQYATRLLAGSPWISGLVLDYTSAASLIGCAIVIGVTLLATAFPAWSALMVATPRADNEDRPIFEGNTMRATLPFALTGRQAHGGIGFLAAFLREHEEMMGAETFYLRDCVLERVPGDNGDEFQMRFTMWLAPLDLGNTQRVVIRTHQDVHEVMTIEVEACRLTGDELSWRAANRGFLAALRQQMLLWRMVEEEARERYRHLAMSAPRVPAEDDRKPTR